MTVSSLDASPVPVRVSFLDQSRMFQVSSRESPFSLMLPLSAEGRSTVKFEYLAQPKSVPSDPRTFGFSAINLSVTDLDWAGTEFAPDQAQPASINWGNEFYPEEHDESLGKSWRWGRYSSSLEIVNSTDAPRTVRFRMSLKTLEPTPKPLRISYPGRTEVIQASLQETPLAIQLKLPARRSTRVKLENLATVRAVPGDPRNLGVAVINPAIESVSTTAEKAAGTR
jgi:hypothetical protein